jgi:hypothetical protein
LQLISGSAATQPISSIESSGNGQEQFDRLDDRFIEVFFLEK